MAEPSALAVFGEGLKTSSDLSNLILAGVRDNLIGAISVGQGNLIMNGVGKVIQIKKLEMQLGTMKRAVESSPFVLPGV